MKRLLAALLPLSLLADAAEAPALRVTAEVGEASLRVRVEAEGLPAGAVLRVDIDREVGALSRRIVPLQSFSLPVEKAGAAEADVPMGGLLRSPARLRVSSRLDEAGQVPEGMRWAPGEARLADPTGTLPYLEALIRDQGLLAQSLTWASEFSSGLEERKAAAAKDPKAGLALWGAWRARQRIRLRQVLEDAGRQDAVFFPATREGLSVLVSQGLDRKEEEAYRSAVQGRPVRTCVPHALHAPPDMRRILLLEIVAYRLETISALAARRRSDEALALWGKDLEEGAPPPGPGLEIPRRGELAALGAALEAWWDADPDTASAKKAAFEGRLKKLRDLLDEEAKR